MLFGGAAAGAGFWFFWRARKKYDSSGWINYTVEEKDNLKNLSEKFFVDWEVLARINRIKPPYVLDAGSVILVPPSGVVPRNAQTPAGETTENFSGEAETESRLFPFVGQSAESMDKNFSANEKNKTNLPAERSGQKAMIQTITDSAEFQPRQAKTFHLAKLKWLAATLVLAVGLAGGLFFIFKTKRKSVQSEKSASIVSLSEDKENAGGPETENREIALPPAEEKEKKSQENDLTDKNELEIKVLNGGAPAGMAEKTKDYLIESGYAKAAAANAEKDGKKGNTVFYQDKKLETFARQISSDLLKNRKIAADVKEAVSAEEKSASIVIVLGQ